MSARARVWLVLALAASSAAGALWEPSDALAQGRRRRRRPRRPATDRTPVEDTTDVPDEPAPSTVPAAVDTPDTRPPVEPPPPPSPPADSAPRPAAVDVMVGFRLAHRDYFYNQDFYRELRGYTLPAAPALMAAAEWYPGAHFSAGPLAWFGLTGAFDYAFIFNSRDAAGNRYRTRSLGYSVGVRVRVPIRDSDVGLSVAYGRLSYTITDPNETSDPAVPDVDYDYLRVGASGRLAVSSRFAFTLGAAYLFVLGAGEITSASYFPRATAGGIDATAGLSLGIAGGIELRTGFTLRRFFYSMNSEPGDARVAGGAVDQYLLFDVGIAWRR